MALTSAEVLPQPGVGKAFPAALALEVGDLWPQHLGPGAEAGSHGCRRLRVCLSSGAPVQAATQFAGLGAKQMHSVPGSKLTTDFKTATVELGSERGPF